MLYLIFSAKTFNMKLVMGDGNHHWQFIIIIATLAFYLEKYQMYCDRVKPLFSWSWSVLTMGLFGACKARMALKFDLIDKTIILQHMMDDIVSFTGLSTIFWIIIWSSFWTKIGEIRKKLCWKHLYFLFLYCEVLLVTCRYGINNIICSVYWGVEGSGIDKQ